jgi:hypothetical protein
MAVPSSPFTFTSTVPEVSSPRRTTMAGTFSAPARRIRAFTQISAFSRGSSL